MSPRRGFVLLAALWIVVAIAAVTADASLRFRASRQASIHVIEESRARAAAEAGIAHAHARLYTALPDPALPARDARRIGDPWGNLAVIIPAEDRMTNSGYRLRARDVAAAVNLNRADEQELRKLLIALRIDAGDADRIAQAALDWRDADDLHRARGAEREHYLRERLPWLPENRPFADVREFARVRGVTPDVFARVRPYITVLGDGFINVNSAPEPVLLTLPGIGPSAAYTILARRRQGRPIGNVQDLFDSLPPVARREFQLEMAEFVRRAVFTTAEVEVLSEGWSGESPVRVRIAALFARGNRTVRMPWWKVM